MTTKAEQSRLFLDCSDLAAIVAFRNSRLGITEEINILSNIQTPLKFLSVLIEKPEIIKQ